MSFLLSCAGRRAKLIQQLKNSANGNCKIIATDLCHTAPALYFADSFYIVPEIVSKDYIGSLLEICEKEHIKVITTLYDPEIEILAKNRKHFEDKGILMLIPSIETALLCHDKYAMFQFLRKNNIDTIDTYLTLEEINYALKNNLINFPIIIKPRFGSGGIGIIRCDNKIDLDFHFSHPINSQKSTETSKICVTIAQKIMHGDDISVDVYVDCFSGKVISLFAKKKLESKIGGANKVVSFYDPKLTDFIINLNDFFQFKGPIDIDLFFQDGKYFVTEINPRFGGGYIYAHALGIDFMKFILKNANAQTNTFDSYYYQTDIEMMLWDDLCFASL